MQCNNPRSHEAPHGGEPNQEAARQRRGGPGRAERAEAKRVKDGHASARQTVAETPEQGPMCKAGALCEGPGEVAQRSRGGSGYMTVVGGATVAVLTVGLAGPATAALGARGYRTAKALAFWAVGSAYSATATCGSGASCAAASRYLKLSPAQTKTVLRTGKEAYKGSTRMGHAFHKHSGRHPAIWGRIKGNMSTWHDQAMRHVRAIFRGPGQFERVETSKGLHFIEKRLADGRGIRLNLDFTFKGFID